MVQDHHRALGERQRGQGVGNRAGSEVALGLRRGPGAGVGCLLQEVREVRRRGRG